MLTKTKLSVYKKYKGDIDMWARTGNNRLMNDSDWHEIEVLIQELTLIKKNLVSEFYALEVNNKLKQICEDEETIELLHRLISHKI